MILFLICIYYFFFVVGLEFEFGYCLDNLDLRKKRKWWWMEIYIKEVIKLLYKCYNNVIGSIFLYYKVKCKWMLKFG